MPTLRLHRRTARQWERAADRLADRSGALYRLADRTADDATRARIEAAAERLADRRDLAYELSGLFASETPGGCIRGA